MSYPDPPYQPVQYHGQPTWSDPQPYGQQTRSDPQPYGQQAWSDPQPYGQQAWSDPQPYGQETDPAWDAETQVQPVYGGPPVPAAPAGRRRRAYVIAGVVAGIVVLGGGAVALASGSGGGGPRTVPLAGATTRDPGTPAASAPAPAGAAPSAPATHRATTAQQTMITWLTRGGQARLDALSTDFGALQHAGDADAQPSAVKTVCTALKRDVAAAQRYAPIPDRIAEQHWRAALADFATGARQCVTAAANLDAPMLTSAGKAMQAGTAELQKVADRIKTMG